MQKKLHLLIAMMMFFATSAIAQVTTSGLAGKVVADGEEVIGATIEAVHNPSGTRYNAVTNTKGMFVINGMRVGGPYTVKISYIGYETKTVEDVTLQLAETYNLNTSLSEDAQQLGEVVVSAKATKFTTEKTGASINITSNQMQNLPTVNRSISDVARLSPYANGMSMAGGDGRSTNFTIDGANFNNNFGLSSKLPGGGNPISMDAIEEVQVVIAPFDVRQTNFIGGGINAITKSGTNQFKGTAYTYFRNQDMRGNRINGVDLGARAEESKTVYGFTLGGPILKDKLFFFVNYEQEKAPGEVIKYRARGDEEKAGGMISAAKASDMELVRNHLINKYGYDPGSYTNFPGDETNRKILARVDWNIIDGHRLSLRYNNTKNVGWQAPNGNSVDVGYRLNGTYRVGVESMAFSNSMYSMENKVQSWSADLNSRFGNSISNQLLATYTNIEDIRGTNSDLFPHIDIMAGYSTDDNGVITQTPKPYITAGYELFSFNNGVKNKIFNITDNFTYFLDAHKITAGVSFEHQVANNAYMRNGTGYYRYRSVDDFLNNRLPESFALTYGFNGVKEPNAQVTFNQIGFYAQDEWNIVDNFKLTYGVRFDNLAFDNSDLATNKAIYDLDFGGKRIDTGKWPSSKIMVSPRVGFVWDVKGDKSLKIRGGSGIFTGRLPLVFFTNMPTNANMVQNSVSFTSKYDNNTVTGHDARLDQFVGGMITNVDEMIKKFNLPTELNENNHVAGSKISGVADNFRMPQIWKSSIAADYNVPVSFPLTLTGEFTFTKNVNAVTINNINLKDQALWNGGKGPERFNGADNRIIYAKDCYYYSGKNAVLLENTSKGYGYTANVTVNAQPVENLNLMFAYTYTESKEISGLPGSDPISTWQGLYTVDGSNYTGIQRSEYVTPHKVIANVGWTIPFTHKGVLRNTHLNLFYSGYSSYGNSYCYVNDMNGDGIKNDLMYIPANDSEIKFNTEDDRKAFWAFVEQDSYLKNHKGQYAEAYAARSPWVNRFDFRLSEDFEFNIGKTKHAFQLSLDIMNIGNMINSKWGIAKTNTSSNANRILNYVGKDANNNPIFSMVKVNGEYPTTSYEFSQDYSQCWKMQIGIKYILK